MANNADSRIIVVDLLEDHEAEAARAASSSLVNFASIHQQLDRLVLLVEGEIEDVEYQNRAVATIQAVQKHAARLAETLREVAAQHAALFSAAKTLRDQRDAAQDRLQAIYDDLVTQIVEANGISRQQAFDLMTLLTNTDEQIMPLDLCTLGDLDAFRAVIADYMQQLEDGFDD